MNQNQIDQLNSEITYPEGKIVFELNKGYTSKLIKSLYKAGYRAVQSGAIHILKDRNGKEVLTGYSWVGLLKNTAVLFR